MIRITHADIVQVSFLRITALGWMALTLGVVAQTNQSVYTDARQNGWLDYGWTRIDYAATNFVHGGTRSISVTITQQYQAIYLHHPAQDAGFFTNLTFWIHGGTNGGQRLQIQALLSGSARPAVSLGTLATNTWQQFTLSLASLGVAGAPDFDGFWIQDRIGAAQPTFYLDDITLIGGTPPPPVTNGPASILVNVASNRHAISELIYGVAFASSNQLKELNAPLHRSGGNAETRYNWQINAHNRGRDFYFESIADSPATPGASGDNHVQVSRNGSAEPMLTIPMIGWVAKLGASRSKLFSYSTNKYGPQTDQDFTYLPEAGNGISATNNNKPITWNDPNDANVLTDSTFHQGYVQHLTNRWGRAAAGGVRYYCMDNEWSIWHSSHRDVHPVGASMREVRDKFLDYAARVKAVDPGAAIAGPEEWGWSGFLYSGYDQQWSAARTNYNPAQFPDRGTNGGWDFAPWFLDQVRQRSTNTGQRLLDVFTVHWYPQGGEFEGDSAFLQALRNRSTRSLWDTNYTDESWINTRVKLIPRLKEWVATYYPGTKIGLTEYNWGAEGNMNGATAQADVLGILGREGLDLATRWTTPATTSPTYKAMKLYRNYDDANSKFGDTSVYAGGPNPDLVSVFAAQRSNDNALTVVVINKTNAVTPATLALTNFLHNGTAQHWVLETNAITRRADVALTGNSFTSSLPAQSITLLVLPAGVKPRLRAGALSATNTLDLWLEGTPGQRYVIEASANLSAWGPLLTNLQTSNTMRIVVGTTPAQRFHRAAWLP